MPAYPSSRIDCYATGKWRNGRRSGFQTLAFFLFRRCFAHASGVGSATLSTRASTRHASATQSRFKSGANGVRNPGCMASQTTTRPSRPGEKARILGQMAPFGWPVLVLRWCYQASKCPNLEAFSGTRNSRKTLTRRSGGATRIRTRGSSLMFASPESIANDLIPFLGGNLRECWKTPFCGPFLRRTSGCLSAGPPVGCEFC
jgi:hypothetical protein